MVGGMGGMGGPVGTGGIVGSGVSPLGYLDDVGPAEEPETSLGPGPSRSRDEEAWLCEEEGEGPPRERGLTASGSM